MDITDARNQTSHEVQLMLQNYKKCCLVKPCSFGKTYMAAGIALMYHAVVIITTASAYRSSIQPKYPSLDEDKHGTVKFVSYYSLARNPEKSLGEIHKAVKHHTGNMLVILDEIHRGGAIGVARSIMKLMETYPNAHYLGLTATPSRADGYDVLKMFFDNHVIGTEEDAPITDYCPERHHYVVSRFNSKQFIDNSPWKERINGNAASFDHIYSKISQKYYTSNNLVSTLSRYRNLYHQESYFKVIAFYPTVAKMRVMIPKLASAFETLYPERKIRVTQFYYKNSATVESCKREPDTIDIMGSINMLGMSYHDDDVTCVIMFRKTRSNNVYTQEIGRVMNYTSTDKNTCVFDFVENCDSTQYKIRRHHNGDPETTYSGDAGIQDELEKFTEKIAKQVTVHNEVLEIKNVVRLQQAFSDAKYANIRSAVVNAYLTKGAPLEYCCKRLNVSEELFLEYIDLYKKAEIET